MKKAVLLASLAILVLTVTTATFFYVSNSKEDKSTQNKSSESTETDKPPTEGDGPPKIKNIGINIDKWDEKTNKAGDIVFKNLRWEDRMFQEYGYKYEPNEVNPNPGFSPHPEFFLPLGSKIFAVSDGVVEDIPTLYSGDYSILVQPYEGSKWTLNYEHVLNPTVKKGDKIKAGQILAEVSPLTAPDNNFGKWALMIYRGGATEEDILSYCPYALFEDSVKAQMQEKITQLVKDWEAFTGKDAYDEETWVSPGCKYEKMTEGEASRGKLDQNSD